MTRFKSSTTTTSHPPGHGHGHAHAQSDLETTNASIFRDVLSEPVIRCLVAESSKETEKSAREKRLRKRREKNRRKEARGREDEGIVAEEVEEDGDDGDDDNDKQDNGSDIEELGDFIDVSIFFISRMIIKTQRPSTESLFISSICHPKSSHPCRTTSAP